MKASMPVPPERPPCGIHGSVHIGLFVPPACCLHAFTQPPPRTCCSLACYHLEEYESALDAFQEACTLEPSKNIHRQWLNMCRVQLGGEPRACCLRGAAGACCNAPAGPSLGLCALGSWGLSLVTGASLDPLHWPAEEPEQPVRKYDLPAATSGPAAQEAKPATSGDGKGSELTLQGEQLQAFLRAAQAGKLPPVLGGAAGPAPVVEEVEEGSEKPVHVKVWGWPGGSGGEGAERCPAANPSAPLKGSASPPPAWPCAWGGGLGLVLLQIPSVHPFSSLPLSNRRWTTRSSPSTGRRPSQVAHAGGWHGCSCQGRQ